MRISINKDIWAFTHYYGNRRNSVGRGCYVSPVSILFMFENGKKMVQFCFTACRFLKRCNSARIIAVDRFIIFSNLFFFGFFQTTRIIVCLLLWKPERILRRSCHVTCRHLAYSKTLLSLFYTAIFLVLLQWRQNNTSSYLIFFPLVFHLTTRTK